MPISIEEIICLGVLVVAGLVSLLYAIRPWRRTSSISNDKLAISNSCAEPPCSPEPPSKNIEPAVSVIVVAGGPEEQTVDMVRGLSEQEGVAFETVVVCRASMENSKLLAGRLADLPGVYVTFIPPGSHNLSERKLAISLGVKAAKAPVVLVTASNVRIPSRRWLAEMAAPFADADVELALGFTHMDFAEMKGPGRWYRQFDTLLYSASWIAAALDGRPYRGDGYNIAFRRDTFFRHKGYAKSVYLHNGDDDLFVHEIARRGNTRMVLSAATIAETVWGDSARRVWRERKARYMFTTRWLPRAPFARIGLIGTLQWTMLASAAAATAIALTAPAPLWAAIAGAILPALIWAAFQLGQIAAYRRLARRLEAVRLWWALPPFLLFHPILNLIFRIESKKQMKANYTWQRF